MDLLLESKEKTFRDEVREFLTEHLTPDLRAGQSGSGSIYPNPDITHRWQQALQRRGWLVPLWPREWGGTGWTPVQRFIFETECALAGAPLVHPMGVRLVGPVILHFGTSAQKNKYLPRILAGEDYWCQGFSEPGAGSDLASLKLQAVANGSDYVLNGSKIWTTHGHFANRMFALVRTSNEGKRQNGISFLLVDMKAPGVSVRPIRTMGGDHELNEVFFDNVRVPQSERIGEENQGWDCAKYLLEFERGAGIFSPRLRLQLNRVGDALEEMKMRGAASSLSARFGEVLADLDTFEMLELKTIGALQPGEAPGPVSSVLKLRSSRLRQAIAEFGLEVLGPEGLRWHGDDVEDTSRTAVDVLLQDFLNSRAFTIFGGSSEVQLGIIAKSLVGI